MNWPVGIRTFPPQVAAFLLRRQLVLEVHPGRPRLDHRLHQLESVDDPSEPGLRVGDDGDQPVALPASLHPIDLIGAQQGVLDPTDQGGDAVDGIEALIRVGLPGEVGVGSHLPAAHVDRFQPGADHLHGLSSGQGAEGGDVGLRVQELPEPLRPAAGQRVFDPHGSPQPDDVEGRVIATDALPARIRRPALLQRLRFRHPQRAVTGHRFPPVRMFTRGTRPVPRDKPSPVR
jgi:hypothetical protein